MVPLDYVLGVALLTVPGGLPDGEPLHEHACLARPLQSLAMHWEIIDPRETHCLLAGPGAFETDLRLVQRRYHELADAPLLEDSRRFPVREVVCDLLTFNRAYHTHVTLRRDSEGDSRPALADAVIEADQLYRIWDLVRDAGSDCYYISFRRQALAALREAIGWADYYRGVLPPHVPVWRFDKRD
jgi:hypothetical protein